MRDAFRLDGRNRDFAREELVGDSALSRVECCERCRDGSDALNARGEPWVEVRVPWRNGDRRNRRYEVSSSGFAVNLILISQPPPTC